MEFLRTRPAATAAAGFIAVSLLGYFAAADVEPALAGAVRVGAACLLGAAGLVFIFFASRKRADTLSGRRGLDAARAALFLSCAAAALISQLYFGYGASGLSVYTDGKGHSVTFTVLEIGRVSSYDASYTVEITRIDGKAPGLFGGGVYAELEADYVLDLGKYGVYTLDGAVCGTVVSDDASEAAYKASRGIRLTLSVTEEASGTNPQPEGEDRPLSGFFTELNLALSQRLMIGLGRDAGGFVSCLLLGRWENLTGTVSRDFRALGVLHLLAISGQHLSVLLGGLELLLRGLNKYIRFAILTAGALFILALTGMSASVARAALMSVLYYAAFIFRRRPDSPTSLFMATAAILAANPASAADLGLIMSFASTLGIITLGKTLTEQGKLRFRAAEFVRLNLLNSLCATLFTLPVSWLLCGQISLMGPLATLIFTLPFTVLLYISPFAVILYGTPLFFLAQYSAAPLSGFISAAAKSMVNLIGNQVVSLRYPFTWVAFVSASAVPIILPRLRIIRIKISNAVRFFAALAVFSAVFGASVGIYGLTVRDTARVLYFGSGKNDTFAVMTGGKSLLCDISDGTYAPAKSAARLAVSRLYATDFDGLLLTHLHRRHVMQFRRLASKYFIRTLILPLPQNEAERLIAGTLKSSAAEYGTDVVWYDASVCDKIFFAGLTLELPPREYIARSTHPVLAMRVSGKDSELLYLGGAASETEDAERYILLDSWARDAEGIIFGAHSPKNKLPAALGGFDSLELLIYASADIRDIESIYATPSAVTVTLSYAGERTAEFRLRVAP